MRHETGSFTGYGGLRIVTQRWLPEDAPRAVVVLAHGIAEHSGRYAHVAALLVEHGYAMAALDHRGHGRSEGQRVMVERFADYVADLHTFVRQVRADYPAPPLFLYGHSMGSLIALLFARDHQDELDGLITTGTALLVPHANRVTTWLLAQLARVAPNLPLVAVDVSAISADPDVVAAYRADPLVHARPIRARMAAELARAAVEARRALPDLRVPYLALHGAADRMTLSGAAQIIRDEAGSRELEVRTYAGLYHEIHNEAQQAEVLADLVAWLDARVPK